MTGVLPPEPGARMGPSSSSPDRSAYRWCLAIVAVSLILKWTVWTIVAPAPTRFLDADSPSYHSPALALLLHHAFTPGPEGPHVPETGRTPGYPLFLAGVYSIFGASPPAAILVQTVVSAGTIVLVFWIARRLWSPRAGVLAALLAGLDVASFAYSLKLMSDTLFTFLLTAMLAAGVLLFTEERRVRWAFAVGVLLTLATMVRPIAYYLVVPLVLGVLAFAWRQRWAWRTAAGVVLAIAVPYVLGVGGWQVRNHALTGSRQFSSLEGFNLLYYRGAAVVALRDGMSLAEARAELGLEEGHREYHPDTGWTPARDEEWRREAVSLILDHPLLFLRSQVRGTALLMLAPGEGPLLRMLGIDLDRSGYFRRFRTPAVAVASVAALLYLALVYTGVAAWAWSRLSSGRIAPVDLFLWGVLLYFVATAGGQGYSRFRVPMMPILVLYGARGLLHFTRADGTRNGRPHPAAEL